MRFDSPFRARAAHATALAAAVLSATLLSACGSDDDNSAATPSAAAQAPTGTRATLAVLETTDLHTNVLSYDYFKLAADNSIGFERVATLIAVARKQYPNTLLFDDGDTIQGTALSDYQALVKPVACDQTLAIYKVMNAAKFDGGAIGNHEFNYGLPYLSQVTGNRFNIDGLPDPSQQKTCAGPNFPQVLSNVISAKTNQPLFQPYTIVTKTVSATAPDGTTVSAPVKVGIIGFTPPAIMNWDKRWLDGKVYTTGLKEATEKYIPEMRAKGADLIVAISHGDLDNSPYSPYSPTMENGSWWLAQVPGIDAMLIGHSHQVFPDATSTVAQFNLPGVDKVKGTVNGVPTVMANYWGKHLGVIKLGLAWDGARWNVDKTYQTTVEARSTQNADKTYVAADPSVSAAIAAEHQATIDYVKTPVGSTDYRMTTYFADVGDPGAIQIVNEAQADYVSTYVQANLPPYASLPVLSASAPFKSGFGGGTDFTDVAPGGLAINNAADLYLYPNTVYAVKISGSDLRNWLETVAKRFNRIDPAQATVQALVSSFPGYNFDMFTSPDLSYEIDVSQPEGSRIRNLLYKGAALDANAQFIVATNNYRASGGGNFPGLDGSKTIFASPDANRDVLISYIKKRGSLSRTNDGAARSWRFTKLPASVAHVRFASAPNLLAQATAAGLTGITQIAADDGSGKGLATYEIGLTQ
ncbi:MAG: 2',3'-cyclic-nucleotide 2'-phosphodiesterase/3'-nucleotidase [Burkholderia gladioli]|nr:MAG: 2',3'-cyclic-nucleotide 2'-phosphodiesterase/3'-nucleotidase [Burkholderia gladioli]